MGSGRAWTWLLLLIPGLLLQVPAAASQVPPHPDRAPLSAEARGGLAKAAQDDALAPWQRAFMQEMARDVRAGAATRPSQTGRAAALRSTGSAADDGTWSIVPPPFERSGHVAVYDPVRDRMVVFGGSDIEGSGIPDVWVLSLSGGPAWTEVTAAGIPPSEHVDHTAIYDPLRDRMVVAGGSGVQALALSGSPVWTELTSTGTPPGVGSGAAIYDPVRDRMVVVAGEGVWALSLAGSPVWTELTPAGTPPGARYGHTAIYDPVRDRIVTFGGSEPYVGARNDVWALSLSGTPTWTELTPLGAPPGERYEHTAIYDPVSDRMVVFGGENDQDTNDAWALSLSGSPAWTELVPAGTPPSGRAYHTAIFDPIRQRMVVFGGYGDGGPHNDAWALSLTEGLAWTVLSGPSPGRRCYHTAIHDPVHDRMVVFGGFAGNDVWALSLSGSPAWTKLTPSGIPPAMRSWHTAIYDPLRQRMVVFGGYDGSHTFNDVWALSLSGSPAWTELVPAGTPPSGREGHTAIYDPVRDRMVVFGGYRFNSSDPLSDVWALSLSGSPTWTELTPAGTPPAPRAHHTAIYDPVRDRVVVFGGFRSETSDVWALSLSGSPAWTELIPAGTTPTGRYYHSAIYDPVRDRMVVFGGVDVDYLTDDAWALSLSGSPTWTSLAPAGTLPSQRYGQTAIYDPVRDRMVVFAGTDNDYLLNEVWALDWSASASNVAVAFDLTPSTLNLMSPSLWVTGFLEPALPHAADAIDIASVRVNGTVPVDPATPTALGDHDNNGVPDLMVKLNRAAVELTLSEGENVPVTVTGAVDGRSFSGTDFIRVHRAAITAPLAGSHLTAGGLTEVRWETPSGVTVESVALLQSLDGGVTWSLVSRGRPNTGRFAWTVPSVATQQAKVAVVLVESSDAAGDLVTGVLGVSEPFVIETLVATGPRGPADLALAIQGPVPNPTAGGRLSVEFTLRDGGPARLDLADVAGRVLTSRQVGTLGPGTHALDISEGGPLRPGIYFLRLEQGGSEVRARAAVIR